MERPVSILGTYDVDDSALRRVVLFDVAVVGASRYPPRNGCRRDRSGNKWNPFTTTIIAFSPRLSAPSLARSLTICERLHSPLTGPQGGTELTWILERRRVLIAVVTGAAKNAGIDSRSSTAAFSSPHAPAASHPVGVLQLNGEARGFITFVSVGRTARFPRKRGPKL